LCLQLFWATVLGYVFQCLTLRLGVITGRDLAQLCRQEYPRTVSFVLWIMAEIAIIGSDIQEVVGTAIAIKLLTGLPLYAGVLITAADTFTFLLIHYFGVRKLEAFFALLISIMASR
jgi:natural resistance-associated macrophage protein